MMDVMGEEIKFTDGKISSRTGVQGEMSTYQISVPIQPGNSGGPLFDNYGNIVGITSSGLNREKFNSENVNYAIKTSYLYNVIESSLPANVIPQGTAMQEKTLTQRIKLAQKFVFMIICSTDPNFHSESLPTRTMENENNEQKQKEVNVSQHQVERHITSNGWIVIEKPDYRTTSDLEITKVVITESHTIVFCRWENKKYYGGWCSIDKDSYLQCKNTGTHYKLLQINDIVYSPQKKNVDYGNTLNFQLYFEKIPDNVDSFDLIENANSDWKIFDIRVK